MTFYYTLEGKQSPRQCNTQLQHWSSTLTIGLWFELCCRAAPCYKVCGVHSLTLVHHVCMCVCCQVRPNTASIGLLSSRHSLGMWMLSLIRPWERSTTFACMAGSSLLRCEEHDTPSHSQQTPSYSHLHNSYTHKAPTQALHEFVAVVATTTPVDDSSRWLSHSARQLTTQAFQEGKDSRPLSAPGEGSWVWQEVGDGWVWQEVGDGGVWQGQVGCGSAVGVGTCALKAPQAA